DDRPEIVLRFCRFHAFGFGCRHFSQSPAKDLTSKLLGDPQCHAMQPRTDAAIQPQRMGPPSQDKEDCLEGVVGVTAVAENTQAGSIHEGAMSADESRKCVLITFDQKSPEKTGI